MRPTTMRMSYAIGDRPDPATTVRYRAVPHRRQSKCLRFIPRRKMVRRASTSEARRPKVVKPHYANPTVGRLLRDQRLLRWYRPSVATAGHPISGRDVLSKIVRLSAIAVWA